MRTNAKLWFVGLTIAMLTLLGVLNVLGGAENQEAMGTPTPTVRSQPLLPDLLGLDVVSSDSCDPRLSSICGSSLSASQNSCCGYSSSGNPYLCCGQNGVEWGNCTWWAWRQYKNATGISLPNYGHAKDWKRYAQPDGSPPMVGSVVVIQPNALPGYPDWRGHVAYVYWVDNPANPTRFKTSNMGCSASKNCATPNYGPYSVVPGVNFIYPPCAVDTTAPTNPNSVTSTSHSINQWSVNWQVTVQWSGANDPGTCSVNGIGGYAWTWTQDPNTIPYPQDSGDANTLQTTSQPLPTGHWYFHVRARDKSNNWADGATHYGPFWIDAESPSNPTVIQETHGAQQGWQNVVNDPAFLWSDADDGRGSGIAYYMLYWGDSITGTPDIQTTGSSFDPTAPCAADLTCLHYLRVQTTDIVGRSSNPETLFQFGYDGVPPGGDFQINNGSAVVFQVMVQIQVDANDTGSGLAYMRLSNDGLNWPKDWQSFTPRFEWQLDYLPNLTQTVQLEVRDGAGNVTALSPQAVYLDLSGSWPRSETYELTADVQGRGGGFGISASHVLTGTIGQVIAGRGISGAMYYLESGFQGAWLANPSSSMPETHYELTDSVIGQGGGAHSSGGYQLNGTLGQPQDVLQMASAHYEIASGFWSRMLSGRLLSSPQTTTLETIHTYPADESTLISTPTFTSTPPPEFYGVSINGSALYTHDYGVTLDLTAPDAVEMMISNDGGFDGAYWEAYATTKTWEIDFYDAYVLPRTVYVRYRDANGVIHGNFTDDVIYDPNLPEGTVSLTEVSTNTATVYINLQDDLSGVSSMMVTTNTNLPSAQWEPYTPWKTITAYSGETVFVYYSDAAGNDSLYPFELIVPGNRVFLPMVTKP